MTRNQRLRVSLNARRIQPANHLGPQTGQSSAEPESNVHRVPCAMNRSRDMRNAARSPSRFAPSTGPRPTPRAKAKPSWGDGVPVILILAILA